MRLTLIGMAGTGKSFWSRKLFEKGFKRFSCDDMIEAKLSAELRDSDGSSVTMGEWMGFPHMSHYQEKEAKYLACEKEVVQDILGHLEKAGPKAREDIVVDTAGSVIYTGEDLLKRLARRTTIVLLATPRQEQARLLNAYLSDPHPMLWRGFYKRADGETHENALRRCYPKLFLSRQRLYERYAEIRLDYYKMRQEGFEAKDLIEEVRSLMRT